MIKTFKKVLSKEIFYLIPILLVFTISFPAILAQEIEDNEIIPHRDLAISYVIGRDGSITANVLDKSFTIIFPELANRFWVSITKIIVNENITTIDYQNGASSVLLTLNMTDNFLDFDIEGRLPEANLLTFKFSDNVKRLGDNRTGLRFPDGNTFYFDWTDITLDTEYIEGSKTLRVDIRSSPNFKLDPRIAITNPDFETGDFTGWTETEGVNCNILTNSTAPLNGTFSAFIDILGDGADNDCDVSQSLGGNEITVFLQFQFRLLTHDLTDNTEIIIAGTNRGGGSEGSVEINHTLTDGIIWQGATQLDSGHTEFRNTSFPEIILDTKYCVEMLWHMDLSASSSNYTLWVNQTQVIMQTGLDSNAQITQNSVFGGQINQQSDIVSSFKVDDFYIDDTNRINTCPEGLSPPPPPPIVIIVVDFFPLAPLMNLFFIVGGFILVFNAKGRLEFQASGMFFFLASILFISVPIYAIIDDTSSLSYVILNYPDGIRNNFVLINFVFIGLGLTSVIINNKAKLGFR